MVIEDALEAYGVGNQTERLYVSRTCAEGPSGYPIVNKKGYTPSDARPAPSRKCALDGHRIHQDDSNG